VRHISNKGLELIKYYEGFSAVPYICPAGYPTIGYGHVIKKHEVFNHEISHLEAENLLRQDILTSEYSVLRLIKVPLSDGQFDALISFTYNLGGGALQRSTLRRKVNQQEHQLVPREFMKWVWAGGRKLPGLIKRRRDEAYLYAS
jgi:lysozyme